jgi:hypothetical protein
MQGCILTKAPALSLCKLYSAKRKVEKARIWLQVARSKENWLLAQKKQ